MTRWPVSSISAISPSSERRTKDGTGAQEGRRRVSPRQRQNARIVTGSGAVTLTAPRMSGVASAHSISPMTSHESKGALDLDRIPP